MISSIESSGIQKTDKLKIVKVLLVIKLKLIELLAKELKIEAKVMHLVSVAKHTERSPKKSDKHELILQFIKNKSGKVSYPELSDLGIAGRSLRRYIKNLSVSGKISVEKKGREYFYTLV